MLKKVIVISLMAIAINLAMLPSALASNSSEKEARFAEKVRSNIQKLGTGPEAQVEVKLKDKTKIKGYVSESNDEQFVVIDQKTGQATAIPYPQVGQVKGNNLSGKVIFAIGFAAILTILAIIAARS